MPAQKIDTDAAFTKRSTMIGQEKHVALCDWSESVMLLFST